MPRGRASYRRQHRPSYRRAAQRSRLRTRPYGARRPAAREPRARRSQDLRLFAEQPDQLADGSRAFADDLAFLTLRRRSERDDFQLPGRGLHRLHFERLLLGRHDPLERRIARLIQSLVRREHRGHRKLHDLDTALDLALGNTLRAVDIEMRDRGDARQTQQLGREHADLMVVVVDRHATEQHQVPGRALELRGDELRGFEGVGGNCVGLQQHTAIRAHGERGADGLLRRRGTEADDHHLPASCFFLATERFFYGEFVIRVQNEFYTRFVEAFAVGGDLNAGFGIGHSLDAYGDFREARKLMLESRTQTGP